MPTGSTSLSVPNEIGQKRQSRHTDLSEQVALCHESASGLRGCTQTLPQGVARPLECDVHGACFILPCRANCLIAFS